MEANTNRYDVGVYFGTEGQSADPLLGKCCRYILSPPTVGIDQEGEEMVDSGMGPYANLDGDSCGDLRPFSKSGKKTYLLISTDVMCTGAEKLTIPYCATWDINQQQICLSSEDLLPGTGSKCKCDDLIVANVIVEDATVEVEALGPPNCYLPGTPVELEFLVTNPTMTVTLENIQFMTPPNTQICCGDPSSCLPEQFSLPAGMSIQCKATIPTTMVPPMEPLVVTIGVTGTDSRSPEVTVTDSFSVSIPSAGMGIVQTVSYESDLDSLTWELTITNTGGTELSGISIASVSIDYLCDPTPLAPTESFTCTTTSSLQGLETCVVENSVSVTGTAGDCPVWDSATTTLTVPERCMDMFQCTVDVCNTDLGECTYTPNSELCTQCPCTTAVCEIGADSWDDGCVHKFAEIIIPSDKQSLACQTVP